MIFLTFPQLLAVNHIQSVIPIVFGFYKRLLKLQTNKYLLKCCFSYNSLLAKILSFHVQWGTMIYIFFLKRLQKQLAGSSTAQARWRINTLSLHKDYNHIPAWLWIFVRQFGHDFQRVLCFELTSTGDIAEASLHSRNKISSAGWKK